jgi:ABC-2 family transporter protein
LSEPLGREYAKSEGLDSPGGSVSFGFGLFSSPLGRDRRDAVRWLELILAGGVADTVGLFLVLIWTAGFLPTFLEPANVTVLLAKPIPRWSLVVGKFLGVLIFVALQAMLFVGGTWLAIGIATGIYDLPYLLTIPVVVLHFAIFYSFSVLLAVWTRSAVVCVLGSLLFWVMCWGINFSHHAMQAWKDRDPTAPTSGVVTAGYWVFPKPGDMSIILFQMMKPPDLPAASMPVPEFSAALERRRLHPEISVLTSLLFSLAILIIAARELHTQDY